MAITTPNSEDDLRPCAAIEFGRIRSLFYGVIGLGSDIGVASSASSFFGANFVRDIGKGLKVTINADFM